MDTMTELQEDSLPKLVEVANHVLHQAVQFIESLKSDDQLTTVSQYLPGSTIGKHLRHARDHYALLLDCLDSPPPRILNYDVRSRNTPMENSRHAALLAFQDTLAKLEKLQVSVDEPVTLKAITPHPQVLQTTFGRELWFCELHAIHHWSMIRVIAGEMEIDVKDASFGFAPSTLVSRGSDAPLGRAKY